MSILELETTKQGDDVRVALSGELDISSAPRVEDELARIEARQPPRLLIDLRQLEFMDSTGLRLLVSADARAREQGRRLALVRGPEIVQRIFKVTRLDERLEILEDADPSAEPAR